jgi:hypothetical protein
MAALAYLLLFLAFCVFLLLWRLESRRVLVATPFLLFCAIEIVAVWPSAIYGYATGLARDTYPVLVAAVAFLSLSAGYLYSLLVVRRRRNLAPRLQQQPVLMDHRSGYYFFGIVLAAGVLLILGLYLYRGLPPIGHNMRDLVTGNVGVEDIAGSATQYRRELTKSYLFGDTESYRGQGMIRLLLRIGWPYLTAMSWLLYRQMRHVRWAVLAGVLAVCTFIFVAGDNTRAPIVYAVAYFGVVLLLTQRVRLRHLAPLALAVVIVFLAVNVLSGKYGASGSQDSALEAGIRTLAQRVALGNGVDDVYVIEFLRSGRMEYRYGAVHWQRILGALPGISFADRPFANELSVLMTGREDSTTYASTTYLGIAYVDFGLPGVIGVHFLMGVLLGITSAVVFSRRKRLETLPLWSWLVFQSGLMVLTGPDGLLSWVFVTLVIAALFHICASVEVLLVPVPGRATMSGPPAVAGRRASRCS